MTGGDSRDVAHSRENDVKDGTGPGVIRRYAAYLPVNEATPRLTLHEGDTPLIAAPRLAEWVGAAELYLKYEGMNPTGSFKDRGMVVAVAKALEAGARAVLCASTGNTAASAAAFAARAGIEAIVLLPRGKVAAGKLAQAVALAERYPVALVNSVNPHRIDGQTTAAYEICDVLGDAPDVLALPVGNGGNVTAYGLGFRRYRERGRTTRVPRILGAQAAGASPFVVGHPIDSPETAATAIRIGRPATWEPAIAAVRDSGGAFRAVTDAEILEAYREIARREGVFSEPASAAGVAALRAAIREGSIDRDARCVCVLTGHGLKDPDQALASGVQARELPADVEAIAGAMGWGLR